jgi:hypothetical protein
MTRKERIEDLKKQLETLSGGKMELGISNDMPEELQEQFLNNVLAFESKATTTNFDQRTRAGVALPDPKNVSDADMHATLWAVIHALARLSVFLNWTNHLSDRQLYEVLWTDILREEIPMLPESNGGAWMIDLPGDDPDLQLYLKHYASEDYRQHWLEHEPEFKMPPHEDPPYDRDRHLPKPLHQSGDTSH